MLYILPQRRQSAEPGVILALFQKELLIVWLASLGVGLRKPVSALLLGDGGCMSFCQPVGEIKGRGSMGVPLGRFDGKPKGVVEQV
eukprot:1151310-Pelagomonas_calceolata.AAC.2